MNDLKSQLIKMGASLLRYRPSTIREDFPNVPAYYRKSVDVYHERGRCAAILLRKAHDKIRDDANKITALETTKQGLERRETEFLLPSINDLQTTITALEAEIKESDSYHNGEHLKDAHRINALGAEKAELVKHATHLPLCDRNSTGIDSRQLFCTCGLDELLSKQEQES